MKEGGKEKGWKKGSSILPPPFSPPFSSFLVIFFSLYRKKHKKVIFKDILRDKDTGDRRTKGAKRNGAEENYDADFSPRPIPIRSPINCI